MPFSLNEELLQGKFIHPCWVLKIKPHGVTRLQTLCWRAENTLEWDERFNMFTEPQLASEGEGGIVPESIGNNNWAMMRCVSYRKY